MQLCLLSWFVWPEISLMFCMLRDNTTILFEGSRTQFSFFVPFLVWEVHVFWSMDYLGVFPYIKAVNPLNFPNTLKLWHPSCMCMWLVSVHVLPPHPAIPEWRFRRRDSCAKSCLSSLEHGYFLSQAQGFELLPPLECVWRTTLKAFGRMVS